MYIEISNSLFCDHFNSVRPDQFSYNALDALYDYYEELEESTGEKIEFDVIAICCEWTEYENIEDFRKDHGDDYETIEDIEQATSVIEFDGGFLVQEF